MFELTTTQGEVLRRRDGEPFRYSTRDLAAIGRKYLSALLGKPLRIREVA